MFKLTPGTEVPIPCGPGDRFCLPEGGRLLLLATLAALPVEDFRFRRLPGCLVVSESEISHVMRKPVFGVSDQV